MNRGVCIIFTLTKIEIFKSQDPLYHVSYKGTQLKQRVRTPNMIKRKKEFAIDLIKVEGDK